MGSLIVSLTDSKWLAHEREGRPLRNCTFYVKHSWPESMPAKFCQSSKMLKLHKEMKRVDVNNVRRGSELELLMHLHYWTW